MRYIAIHFCTAFDLFVNNRHDKKKFDIFVKHFSVYLKITVIKKFMLIKNYITENWCVPDTADNHSQNRNTKLTDMSHMSTLPMLCYLRKPWFSAKTKRTKWVPNSVMACNRRTNWSHIPCVLVQNPGPECRIGPWLVAAGRIGWTARSVRSKTFLAP